MAIVYVDTVDTIPTVANGDSIVIDRGGQKIISNVDHSAIAGIVDLTVSGKFAGDLGSAAGYFTAAITGRALWEGSGNFFYTINGSGTDACASLVNAGHGNIYVAGTGTLTKCDAMSGKTVIGEGVDLTTLRNVGGNVIAEYDATAITNFDQSAGTTIIRRPGPGSAATWAVCGGTLEIGRKVVSATALTYTNVTFIVGNATLKISAEGTIPAIKLLHPNAKLDLTEVPDALTITALSGDPIALKNTGLRNGVNSKYGSAMTITIDYFGKSPEQFSNYSGVSL